VDGGAGNRQDRTWPGALRDYALLADGERGAVVGPRGEIVWMCAPRWDSDAVFAALVGGEAAYTVTPRSRFVWGGYYEQGSLIWRSRWVRPMTETVVITGASAGIARATARLYGERGANVGLIARGQAGLDGAARDVEEAGGKALAISADVADYGQVEDAARQVEEFFGPIDVWINVAFTSVFAPFADISAAEFRRVTEVSYLGFVYGTMVALDRMRARDRGTIVQVGSALGARSIPLQSAYCGAKHAINGFTSSLRCELLHEHSGIRVTVVQMPAVNTPQFSWVRSKLPNHPQPVPPIYQPEVAARGVVFAADHPRRKQYWVGYSSQQTAQEVEPGRPDNLWEPADGPAGHDFGARGTFDDRSHDRSPQLWMSQHAGLLAGAAAGSAVLGGALAVRLARAR
jgi:NAD(P)-dependent dehydrogenase (short-subunit alcohol dehydrogenase family)